MKCSWGIAFVLSLFLFVGCTTFPGANVQKPSEKEQHEVAITLTNMDKEAITAVINSRVDWDAPGLLKPSQLLMVDEKLGRAWFKLFSGIGTSDTTRFKQDVIYLYQKTNVRDITLLINSPGGSAFAGLALAGLVKNAQEDKGFVVRAEAYGIVASAAVPVFAQCKPFRKAVDGTIFMVHESSIFKWPGRETASDIRSQGKLMDLLEEKYMMFLVDNSKLSYEKWLERIARTSWFDAKQAKKWGLVD